MVMFRPEGVSVRVPSGQLSEQIAKGSCAEVRSMYLIADALGFIDTQTCRQRCATCESIAKQLNGFAKYLRN